MNRRRAVLLVASLAVVATAVGGAIAVANGGDWTPALELWLARASGWVALGFLFGALVATPVGRIAARLERGGPVARAVPPLRRAAGISAACLALLHATVALSGWLDGAWAAVLSWPYLRAGLVALCVLSALMITSFPRPVRLLRVRVWKPLHRLSYAAGALVLLHLVLSPFAPRALTLVLFAALLAVGLARLIPRPAGPARRAPAPARSRERS